MHATYYFLAGLDRTRDEGSLWTQAEDRIIGYSATFCDENNYWDVESIVLDDNQWAISEGWFRHTPGQWCRAWVEATWAVAYEFKWYLPTTYTAGRLPGLKADMTRSRESIAQIICDEVPAFLAGCYGQRPPPKPGSDDSLDRYRRSQIAMAYELFLTPAEPDRYPFTDRMRTPYDYRAFDLSAGDPANAIIRVDIHT